jgi:hypothetical protein
LPSISKDSPSAPSKYRRCYQPADTYNIVDFHREHKTLAKASCTSSWGLEIWMQLIGMGAEEKKMAKQNTRKCAHIPCLCDVADGEQYCGQICRDAGSEDVEIALSM